MKLTGYQLEFDCKNEQQYESIGRFWDDMSAAYGRENLFGVGYGWHDDIICYLIGHDTPDMLLADRQIEKLYEGIELLTLELPDEGWVRYAGETGQLSRLYGEIYAQGSPLYEIERFFENGSCEIMIYREAQGSRG